MFYIMAGIQIQYNGGNHQPIKNTKYKDMLINKIPPKSNKISNKSSARLLNNSKIPKLYGHKNKQQSTYTSIKTLTSNDISKIQRKIQLNDQILHHRKQNYLNTCYNKRLNVLKDITKQNRKIYVRINSQKSLYSQDDMNRSRVSIRSLSRSSSRVSNCSKKSQKNSRQIKYQKQNYTAFSIHPQSLDNVKDDKIKQFKSLFALQNKPINKNRRLLNYSKSNNRSFSVKIQSEAISNTKHNKPMGNILHQIAQQMFENPNKRVFYNKKKAFF